MSRKKFLIAGMSGLIGSAVRRQLKGRFELSALNRRDIPGIPCHRASVTDLEAILPAFQDIHTVVHLAASIKGDWDEILQNNVIGTYNVFEAARRSGVKRIVYASSGSVIAGWEKAPPYRDISQGQYKNVPDGFLKVTHETPIRPVQLYGCSKVWGEGLARHFTDTTDLSILCLRIGAVLSADRPSQPRHEPVWCSQRDIARLVEACIGSPEDLKFDIFYAVSNNKWSYRDMFHAKDVLGYEPLDSVENLGK